jgi:hypothetical protein
LTGIKGSPPQVRKFLKSLEMKCLKVGSLPSKADQDEQEDYKEKKLEPRLNNAKEGKRAVFFVDAAPLVMGAFLGIGVLRDFSLSPRTGVNALMFEEH